MVGYITRNEDVAMDADMVGEELEDGHDTPDDVLAMRGITEAERLAMLERALEQDHIEYLRGTHDVTESELQAIPF